MAVYRYTTTTYYFTPPPIISEVEFNALQKKLKSNPVFEFEPQISFRNKFPITWWMIRIAACFIPIELIGLANRPIAESAWDNILAIGLLTIVITVFTLIFGFTAYTSFNTFLRDKKNFYATLKRMISSSASYQAFE
ncbi:MAG: hypothetical protein ABIQ74_11020 [Chitinophagales bacterium]